MSDKFQEKSNSTSRVAVLEKETLNEDGQQTTEINWQNKCINKTTVSKNV
jgi:hypothetical protein